MKSYQAIKVEKQDGIGWVILNRPEKRNAMTPQMHFEMDEVLPMLEADPEVKCIVLTGAGESFCAGQDLNEFFRKLEGKPYEQKMASAAADRWRWDWLYKNDKPTIAMVNGYCFGGAFTALCACDFALAADDAKMGLSEVNWGGMPAAMVARAITEAVGYRTALDICCTGRVFTGKEAAEMKLVNRAVPRANLREETVAFCKMLMEKDPEALRATKQAAKFVQRMDFMQAYDYLMAKNAELRFRGKDSRQAGFKAFLDDKTYKPGMGSYTEKKA